MKEKVFFLLTRIPKGKVVTYGQLAAMLGNPGLSRYVGNVLHRNPDGERYPCYKVVNSQGKLSAHYAFGGMDAQAERLRQEGIPVEKGRVDLAVYRWDPHLS